MIRLSPRLLPTLHFSPDDPVVAMKLSVHRQICVLALTQAYVGENTTLYGVRLELGSWQTLSIRCHDFSDGLKVLDDLPDELAGICEFELTPDHLQIAGFCRKAHGYYDLSFRGA